MNQEKNEAVPIIDAYWEGPYSSINIGENQDLEGHCLYQIYGTHPVYGANTLLYIGRTNRKKIYTRLKEHSWIDAQSDECQIFVASCGYFMGWDKWHEDKRERYEPYQCDSILLSAIESLLIYAHQPSYNSANLKSTSFAKLPFRLFNSGRRAMLNPEISTQFYSDSPQTLPVSEERVNN